MAGTILYIHTVISKELSMSEIASPVSQARDSYELIGRRIQRLIAAPSVQKVQAITVTRLEAEPAEAWQQVLQEIEETSGVSMERLESGAVRIGWREYCEA
jgi:hypothetical protein